VTPEGFLADVEAAPGRLLDLAESLSRGNPWAGTPVVPGSALVLLGMGSSAYAAGVGAARLRARGIDAVAELASSDLLPAVRPGTVVVVVSASGTSPEAVAAAEHYRGRAPVVALTEAPSSPVAGLADAVVPLLAGPEAGGVACRTFRHTLALLLALEQDLTGSRRTVADLVRAAAAATSDLVDRRDQWLEPVTGLLTGPDGCAVVAPARRLSSAQQGALMLREGPRRRAVSCETGDWSHVDVYLTRSTDYRMLLMAGSRWEDELLRWIRERGSTVVAVGADVPGAAATVRFRGDEDDDVRLLAEVTVPELVAAQLWQASTSA
jgi:glutamine---fructose-6-phosphate transaminase (isomerizing)